MVKYSYQAGEKTGIKAFRNQSHDEFGQTELTWRHLVELIRYAYLSCLINPRDVEDNFASNQVRAAYAVRQFCKKEAQLARDNLFCGSKIDWFITKHKVESLWLF